MSPVDLKTAPTAVPGLAEPQVGLSMSDREQALDSARDLHGKPLSQSRPAREGRKAAAPPSLPISIDLQGGRRRSPSRQELSVQPRGESRVLVVDSHPIVRQGLAALINQEPGLVVCGQASSVEDALALVRDKKPHIVTVDITLHGLSGIALARQIKSQFPDVPVLILSTHDEAVYAERALRAGARGYIMKSEPVPQIMAAIHKVLRGEVYVSDRFAAGLLRRVVTGRGGVQPAPVSQLSDRELQVFQCIGQGMKLSEIARQLQVKVKTIEAHREHIKQKLNLPNSSELLRYAIQAASPRGAN
jgi:DNA-binding NarL/FixJ family response regulator